MPNEGAARRPATPTGERAGRGGGSGLSVAHTTASVDGRPPRRQWPARLWHAVARPVYRLLLRCIPAPEAWEEIPDVPVPERAFGAGSTKPFSWYFEGECAVRIASLSELSAWLLECAYVPDRVQFGEQDVWQHPIMFERTRKGDCDDHAVWAWRQLVALGLQARLYSGIWSPPTAPIRPPHVWVVFEDEAGRELLLESVSKLARTIIRPLEEARAEYTPFFSVGPDWRVRCHGGYVQHLLHPVARQPSW